MHVLDAGMPGFPALPYVRCLCTYVRAYVSACLCVKAIYGLVHFVDGIVDL